MPLQVPGNSCKGGVVRPEVAQVRVRKFLLGRKVTDVARRLAVPLHFGRRGLCLLTAGLRLDGPEIDEIGVSELSFVQEFPYGPAVSAPLQGAVGFFGPDSAADGGTVVVRDDGDSSSSEGIAKSRAVVIDARGPLLSPVLADWPLSLCWCWVMGGPSLALVTGCSPLVIILS